MPWFDARTNWEKSSDEYFEKLDELAQQLDDVDAGLNFYTSLTPEDFDSGYEYVYGRIKELKQYIAQHATSDESSNHVNCYEARESLQDIYEELLDLYDAALLYDDYCDADPDDLDNDDGDDDDWDSDDDAWDDYAWK